MAAGGQIERSQRALTHTSPKPQRGILLRSEPSLALDRRAIDRLRIDWGKTRPRFLHVGGIPALRRD